MNYSHGFLIVFAAVTSLDWLVYSARSVPRLVVVGCRLDRRVD